MLKNDRFYLGAYKKYGVTPKGLNWNSKESQYKRFETLTNLLKDEIQDSLIADIGCGFGDLVLFWKEKGIKPKNYIGVEAIEEFANIAKERLKGFDFVRVLHKDILTEPFFTVDWCVASGS